MKSLLQIGKAAQLGNLQDIILTLVVVGIILGIGFLVLEEFRDKMTVGSEAWAGVNDTIDAVKEIPGWLSIVVILAIVGVLLAIVFSVLPRASVGV